MKKVSEISKKQHSGDLKVIKALSDYSQHLRSSADQTKAALDAIQNNLDDIKKKIENYLY